MTNTLTVLWSSAGKVYSSQVALIEGYTTEADIPRIIATKHGASATVLTCDWFAMCGRPAAVLVDHPALGKVQACQACADRASA